MSVPHALRPTSWAVVHRTGDLAPFEVREVDGLRCTDATRTLCDLGAVVDTSLLERALESALRRRLTSLPRLRWRVAQLARPGRPGPAALRRLLDQRPSGATPSGSDLETRFLQCLAAAGLPAPERQHQVRLAPGGVVHLDVAWPARRVFVELDGERWHGDWAARRRDHRRQTELVLLGWTPLRFTFEDVVRDADDTVEQVRRALAS